MRKYVLLVSTLGFSAAMLTGCAGTGPNTQQGAVTGGALGAIAGAIIGHNSGSGNTLGGALIGGAAGALAGGTLGNAKDHEDGTAYDDSAPAAHRTYRVVQSVPPTPPPPMANEVVTPSPAANAVWIPGYWTFQANTYAWVAGHWEIPPANAHERIPDHWENNGSGYVYVQSYWR